MDIFMTEPLSEAEQKELEEQQIAYKQQLITSVSGNDAVSYTHLDVYKRQLLYH